MGELFSGGRSGSKSKKETPSKPNNVIGGFKPGDKSVPEGVSLSSGGFMDNGARRMPSQNDQVYLENVRKARLMLQARSGRTSTDLSSKRSLYTNNFAGRS